MSKSEKTLWELAIDHSHTLEEGQVNEEASVLFVGSKGAGKTSMILRFLDRDEIPKPTTALEYTFGRRAKGHNIAKDVGHIWELGGGTWLSQLMDIPINKDSISHISAVLVLDLSKPNELWFTLEKLLKELRSRVDACIQEARADDPGVKDRLKKQMWERLGEDLPDKDMMEPFLIPLVIVGTKYDLFQELESEKRKVISKTLRFVAHVHGATLQCFSVKQDALVNKSRATISHLLFGTPSSKSTQYEHNKPLLVPAGTDTLAQIGNPPLPDGDIGRVTARTPLELWKQAYTSYFPQDNISDPSLVEDPARDSQYKEPAVDTMRAQKNEELEKYRKLSERRARENQLKGDTRA